MLTLYFIKLNLYLSSPYISRVTQNQYAVGEAFVNVQFSVSAPAMNTEGTHSVPSVLVYYTASAPQQDTNLFFSYFSFFQIGEERRRARARACCIHNSEHSPAERLPWLKLPIGNLPGKSKKNKISISDEWDHKYILLKILF